MQVEELCVYNVQKKNGATFEDENCPGELKDDIKAIIKSEDFINYDTKINKIPMNGGNYIAELYEVDIKGKTILEDEKEINLFVKQMFLSEPNECFDFPKFFKSEQFFYKEIGKKFQALQEEAKIPLNERVNIAKCYNSNPASIIMDNLCKKGYKVCSRLEAVSLDYIKLAIKNLAKLHALSFVVEKRDPEFFNNELKTIKFPINFGVQFDRFREAVYTLAINYLEEDFKNRVKDTIHEKLYKYSQYLEKSATIMCLCHGDYRAMNIMVKEIDGELTDMIPLDYQLIHYGNPVLDFIYLIFSATDYKLRKSHLENLKRLYFETLESFLKYFDINAEEVFPRRTFEKMYEEALDYGLITMVFVGPFIFADENNVPDLAKDSLESISFKVDDVYKDLLRSICNEFIEWGLLA